MRVLIGLIASLIIDFLLVLAAVAFIKDWPSACFFIVFSWPLIWLCIIAYQVDEPQHIDLIKMQNYFNLDAVRRNTDRMK
jgi:hypothetical protein